MEGWENILYKWFGKRFAKPLSNELICPICGGKEFNQHKVLWEELIQEWQLAPLEVDYINRQQGFHCVACGSNLRSMTLAGSMLEHYRIKGTFKKNSINSSLSKRLALLEINEAGTLNPYFRNFHHHSLVQYPDVDMQSMPFQSESWDAIVHSDVLEHVSLPERALKECCRVLKPGGVLFFTIPIVYRRLSRSRENLRPSHHGTSASTPSDYLVHTEFGADFWVMLMEAGFKKITLFCLTGPESIAIICSKHSSEC